MTVRARFIGVGRFESIQIRDLAGCSRDARALESLFRDSVADLDSQLIIDRAATAATMRSAVVETLESATKDDVVILTFATHGTRNHKIVAYDTNPADVAATTLSMSELSDSFRRCRARFVLCILDCCFGGSAPARVALEVPPTRDAMDLQSFSGTGRLLLAASRPDEPAYEHPRLQHGLLTAALLDALTAGEGLSVLGVVEDVLARVRAEAATMGVEQHPVASTYVDGGFALPTFRRGENYLAAFPEYGGVTAATISEIERFDIPAEIVAEWANRFGDTLRPIQLDAINQHRVLDGRSLLVLAPTSSGKTFIGEMAAVRAVLEGRKAVFSLPFRALVNEKYDDFQALYGERLGMRVIRCAGDFHDEVAEFGAGKFDIALLTNEMLLGRALAVPSTLDLLGLIVVDEAQMITDPNRGATVELILTLLRGSRARGIEPQIVLLSATVGAVNHLNEWLEIDTLRSDLRPVPLEFGVIDRSGTFEFKDADGNIGTRQLVSPGVIVQRRRDPSAQDVIVPLARQLLSDHENAESVIIFRNQRGTASGAAIYLAHELGLPTASRTLAALPHNDLSSSSMRLREALQGGTAFHTGDLTREERVTVEHAFREREGEVRAIVATSTISAGINTPASTVIIVETNVPAAGNPPMNVSAVQNMAGRAGRLGYREAGRAIIYATNAYDRRLLFNRYVTASPEPFTSSFSELNLTTWVLRLLRQTAGQGIPRHEVATLLTNTFGGYLRSRADAGFLARLNQSVEALVTRMLGLGLLEERDDGVRLTMLGEACGQSVLSFESCLLVLEAGRAVQGRLTNETLLLITASLPEADEIYLPHLKRGTGEPRWWQEAQGRFRESALILRRGVADVPSLAARAKRVLVALAWADGVPMEAIERRFTVNDRYAGVDSGSIRSAAEGLRFRLSSVYDILTVNEASRIPPPEDFAAFMSCLEFGIPRQALGLLEVRTSLTRGDQLELLAAQIPDETTLWSLEPEVLRLRISENLVVRLERVRPRTTEAK